MKQILEDPLVQGGVYPGVYLRKPRFERLLKEQTSPLDYRKFYVLRDLRDTLVSLYFSLLVSHDILNERMQRKRAVLQDLDKAEGMLHLMHSEAAPRLDGIADLQRSWLADSATVIRYEELLSEPYPAFRKIVEIGEFPIGDEHLQDILQRNSFESLSGRPPGQEDPNSYYRKGVAGDWAEHFTPDLKTEFKRRFGELLIQTGYESDLDW